MKKLSIILFLFFINISSAKEYNLNELINIGIKNNPFLNAKYYEYQKNIYFEKENLFNLLPKISLEYKYLSQDEQKLDESFNLLVWNGTTPTGLTVPYKFSFTFVPSSFYNFNLMIKEVLSPALYQAYKISRGVKDISYYNYLNERNKLIDKISKAYFDYQNIYYSYKVAQSYLNLTSTLYKNAKYLYEKGLITKKDLLQAKYYYQKAIEGLVKAINYKNISKKYLETLTNSKIDEIYILSPEKVYKNLENLKFSSSNYYYNLAKENNPTFKILNEKEKLAYKKYNLEKYKAMPNFFAFLGYTKTDQFEALGTIDYTSVGFGISWQVGLNNYAAIIKEKKSILESKYENENMKNLIALDINQTLYKLKTNVYTIQAALVRIKEAQEIYKMANLKYKEGLATTKEVYDAIKDLNEAKKELAQGVFNFLSNYYHLNYLTGFKLPNILDEASSKSTLFQEENNIIFNTEN